MYVYVQRFKAWHAMKTARREPGSADLSRSIGLRSIYYWTDWISDGMEGGSLDINTTLASMVISPSKHA